MKLFITLCIVALAVAKPDVSHLVQNGYKYEKPATSYGVPLNSVEATSSNNNLKLVAQNSNLQLPVREHQQFQETFQRSGALVGNSPLTLTSTSTGNLAGLGGGLNSFNSFDFGSGLNGGLSGGLNGGFSNDFNVNSGFQNQEFQPDLSGFANFNNAANLGGGLTSVNTVKSFGNSGFGLDTSNFGGSLNGFGSSDNFNLGLSNNAHNLNLGNAGVSNVQTSKSSINLNTQTGSVGTHQEKQPEVVRNLYFFAAPEEPEEAPRARIHYDAPAPRKNLKVIFIKAPSPPAAAPITLPAPQQVEEKTLVYVLVKKPEAQQDIQIQTATPTQPSKPEVYFIRYKTQEEAQAAIEKVQNGQHGVSAGFASSLEGNSAFTGSLSRDSSNTQANDQIELFQTRSGDFGNTGNTVSVKTVVSGGQPAALNLGHSETTFVSGSTGGSIGGGVVSSGSVTSEAHNEGESGSQVVVSGSTTTTESAPSTSESSSNSNDGESESSSNSNGGGSALVNIITRNDASFTSTISSTVPTTKEEEHTEEIEANVVALAGGSDNKEAAFKVYGPPK